MFPRETSRGERKAVLKIQVIYDVLSNRFIHFDVTPFTVNDQSQSKNILTIARKGDLVLRDLGYFLIDCIKQLLQKEIHFVSRIKFNVKISEVSNLMDVNLLAILRKHADIDKWVNIGKSKETMVRLVAVPLPEEMANRRRQKAKKDRDRRLKHSRAYYQQLGYSIFITSEPKENFTATQIAKLYNLRWRIETIFKCWKSHFNFQLLIPANNTIRQYHAEAIIYMMLIFCLLFQVYALNHLLKLGYKSISIIKLCRYLSVNILTVLANSIDKLVPEFVKYCSYENRKDRLNFMEKLKLS